jgi:predicted NAD-dependent protein-ADP-ribosyltransferase YbiA (DUF1768 family)
VQNGVSRGGRERRGDRAERERRDAGGMDDTDDTFDPDKEVHFLSKKGPFYLHSRALSKKSTLGGGGFHKSWLTVTHVSPDLRADVRALLAGKTFPLGAFQAVCFAKAIAAFDHGLARRVHRTRTQWDVVEVWQRLDAESVLPSWALSVQDILETVYMCVVERDDGYKQRLLETHPHYLAYLSKDVTMGIGHSTVADASREGAMWTGLNMCGEALLEVRALARQGRGDEWRHRDGVVLRGGGKRGGRGRGRDVGTAQPSDVVVGPIDIVGE